MKNCILAFLLFFAFESQSQIPWAMFHACEKHCGIYPVKEYKSFADTKWKFKTGGKIFSSPAIYNGVAYIGSEDKNLYAIETATGKLKWKFSTGGAVHSSPAYFNNTVYFGSFDGYYYALNATTGKEKWKFKTGGEKWMGGIGYFGMLPADKFNDDLWEFYLSSPIIDINDKERTVYFGSSDGNVYAVTAETGALKWKFQTNGIVHSSPALYQGKIYVGSWDTYMYALDAKTGKEVWKFKTGDQPYMTGIQASATMDNGMVYFGARDANFYALNSESGELVWKYDVKGSWVLTTAGAKDGVVYLGTSDSFLFIALDGKTGQEKFQFKTNGYLYSSPALVGNTAFFGDFTGKMYALDLGSQGKTADVFETASRKANASKVLNKEGNLDFMFAAEDKDLNQYSINKEVMDRFYSLGSVVSSPAVGDGVIYFGSTDGYLYAVNLKGEAEKALNTHEGHH